MYNENYYYDKYNKNSKFSLSNLNLKGKLILGGVLLIVVILIIVVIDSVKNYRNSYEYLEKQMISIAKDYVTDNNLIVTDEIYLDVSKLNMNIKDNCSKISGVFVDNNYNYQAYLSCDNYQSDVIDNDETKVSLKGEEVVLLAKGISYYEMGVSSNKEVIVQGEVGTEEGVYNINYFINQNNIPVAVLKRKVVIVDNSYIKSLFPTITLKGDSIVYHRKGDTYSDAGVLAGDIVDFDLSKKVKVTNNVNVNIEGEYEVSYIVTNSRGYTNQVTRKVVVVNNFSTTIMTAYLSTNNMTNEDVTINLKVIGDDYDYVLLPDDTITRNTSISYKVSSNGIYNFVAHDKDGKKSTKIIPINNIDKVKPTGVCNAIVYNDYANIVVNPNSGKKISSYMYIINGINYIELTSNSYKAGVNAKVNNVSVILKDSVGNNNTLNCNVTYADPTIGNPNIKYYNVFNDEYVIPNTKNDLKMFVDRVHHQISQSADPKNCGSACLSFSLYHGYYLQYGNMNAMNMNDACTYKYPIRYDIIYSKTKEPLLKMIYDEIFAGRVVVLQIDAKDSDGSGYHRHFGLVVGYRRSVYNRDSLKDTDLIFIDSWSGALRSLDPKIDDGRHMYYDIHQGPDQEGYRIDKIKPEYYQ